MIVAKSCLTLCDPMDCSLPGSCVHGILQARIWSGLPFPSPGDLPHPGIEHKSPALQPDSSPSEPLWKSLSLLRSLISRVSFCCVFFHTLVTPHAFIQGDRSAYLLGAVGPPPTSTVTSVVRPEVETDLCAPRGTRPVRRCPSAKTRPLSVTRLS